MQFVMATSSKATHGILAAELLAAMMTVVLFAGTCTAQQPNPLPALTTTIANQLTMSLTYAVAVTGPLGTQLSRSSVVVGPGQTGQVTLGVATAAGTVSTQTITVGNSVYAVQSTILSQLLGQTGALTYTVSSPCPGNQPGLYITTTSNLPLGSGADANFCTGAPIS